MSSIDRRGELVAFLGWMVSLLGAVILGLLAVYTGNTSSAIWAVAFFVLGASGTWLLTLIQLHQRRLLAEERLELAELERDRQEKLGGTKTIFNEEELDQMDRLAMGRRLRAVEKYLIPVLALLFAAYLLVAGVSILPWIWQFPPIAKAGTGVILDPMVQAIVCGAVAFICFMLSRYALGMSSQKQWDLLCAGGNFSFGASVAGLAASVSLLCASSDLRSVELWAGRIIGFLMIWLAAETVVNFILDFYRPRVPGERQRPFYDSRLLGMFSEPGGILHSMANAIDYQFGFKVSETWFYKLLGQAVLPLILVQIIVLFALSCLVVVPPGHKAVIEHYGLQQTTTWAADSGIHLTWFWPIDRATVIPVDRIRRMELGYEPEEEEAHRSKQPILWTKAHYKKEYKLLAGDKGATSETKALPVNLLSMTVPVQWRVKPADAQVIRFHSQSQDVEQIIESLAYREITRFAAQADILDLLGRGGIEAADTLKRNLQTACDQAGFDGLGLGVEIAFVGVGMIHPPPEEQVSKAYEDVVSAYEFKQSEVMRAEGEAAELKVGSAGNEWLRLYQAINQEDDARKNASPEQSRLAAEVEELLLRGCGGDAREMVARASQRTLARVFGEKSAAERYAWQVMAYEAAPSVYLLRLYLRTLEDGLKGVQKFLVMTDHPEKVIYLPDARPPAGIDTLGAELSAMEQKAPE